MKYFSKDFLQEMLWGEGVELLENELLEVSRWQQHFRMTFKLPDGDIYQVRYTKGATEQQDEQPFEYADDIVPCVQVRPRTQVITVYEPIED